MLSKTLPVHNLIQRSLFNHRYSSRRPALVVGVYPYDSLQRDPFKELTEGYKSTVPVNHLQEMVLFASRVAKTYNLNRTKNSL